MIYFWEISCANNYYSTEQAILSIIDQIQRGIDDNDFSKSSGGVVLRAFAPTFMALVRFPDSASYVGWVCWFFSQLWEVFPWVLWFSPLLKNLH